MTITLYHNPNCSKSRAALGLLEERGLPFRTIAYLDQPPGREDLEALMTALGGDPKQLLRHNDKAFAELGLSVPETATAADIVEILLAHPKFLQRPIVEVAGRAVIGRPPERVLELL